MVRHFELSDQFNFKPHRLISRKITKLLTFVFTSSFAAATVSAAAAAAAAGTETVEQYLEEINAC